MTDRQSSHETEQMQPGTPGPRQVAGAIQVPVKYMDVNGSGYIGESSDFRQSLYGLVSAVAGRKWLIVAILTLAIVASAVYAFTRTPVYVSTALLRIEQNPSTAVGLSGVLDSFAYFSVFYQTHLELLKTGNLPTRNLGRLRAIPGQAGGPADLGMSLPPEQVQGKTSLKEGKLGDQTRSPLPVKIEAGGEEGTRLIRLQMSADDPFAARDMLRRYIGEYIERDRQERVELAKSISEGLKKDLREAENQLRKSQQELLDFTIKHGVFFSGGGSGANTAILDSYRRKFLESKAEKWRLEHMAGEMKRIVPDRVSDKLLQDLKQKAATMKSEYESLGSYYGARNFQKEILKSKTRSLEKAIEEIETNALSTSLDSARNKERLAKEAYDKAKQDAMKSDSPALRYQVLKKTAEADGDLYLKLTQQVRQAEIYDGLMEQPIVVESSPTLPVEPVYPNKIKIVGMSSLVGLLGGLGLALLLGWMDKTVKTTDEVKHRLNIPVLGVVPRVKRGDLRFANDDEERNTPVELSPYRLPMSPLADALGIIHNSVTGRLGGGAGLVLAISSALPSEGKTFIAVSLAAAIASERKAVLVIDGDLRNPRIHILFGRAEIGPGVSEVLTGQCAGVMEAIRRTQIPGLYYMPSGRRPENPVSVVKSPILKELLSAARKSFGVVIVDTPPILGLADTPVLAESTDGLILVARQASTPFEAVRSAREAVLQGQGRLLGAVLNMAEPRASFLGYYGGLYSRYHRPGVAADAEAASRV